MKATCYDIVIILDPKLSEAALKDLLNTKVRKLISSMGGEILTEDNWGIKKLSHPIKHNREGFYYFIKARLKPENLKEINYNLKITEGILRASIIKSMIEVVK